MSVKGLMTKYVVDVATTLFLKHGINNVTIKDIADEADIGEATIYRHFLKKQNIVLASALLLKEKVLQGYFDLSKSETGFGKLEIFYNSYLEIFKSNPQYYYFINEFDAYMCMEETVSLDEYEREIDSFKAPFLGAYELGLEDKTVTKMDSIETFYYSTTHALLELCKKLSANRALLKQDLSENKVEQIKCLIEIILNSLEVS